MQPTRVVVINDVSVAKGGATALALQSVRLMCARGIKVTYLTGDAGANPEFKTLGVEVAALNGTLLSEGVSSKTFLPGLYNRQAAAFVSEWIDENDSPETIYHLHGWSQVFSPSIFTALKKVQARTVLTAHDYFLGCPNGSYANLRTDVTCELKPMSLGCAMENCDKRNYAHKGWRLIRHSVLKQMFRSGFRPGRILAIHKELKSFLVETGFTQMKIDIVPNPVTPLSETRVMAEENQKALFIGRMSYEKGADLLARAARDAGVTVGFVGEGDQESVIRTINPDAELWSWQDHAGLSRIIQQARFLVMPSRCRETFGLVLVEALTAGVPVIVTDKALLSDTIKQNGYGEVVDVRDQNALAHQLRRFAEDDELIRTMSHLAFTKAGELALTNDGWIAAHLKIYDELMSSALTTTAHQNMNAPTAIGETNL